MIIRQRTLPRLIELEGGSVSKLRLFKFAFLLRESAKDSPASALYEFLPYQFGPYSFTLNYELRSMERDGWLRVDAEIKAPRTLEPETKKLERPLAAAIESLVRGYRDSSNDELIDDVFDSSLSKLLFSVRIGSGWSERLSDFAIGPDNTVYLAGTRGTECGPCQGFPILTRVSSDATAVLYSVVLPGGVPCGAYALAAANDGSAYAAGDTRAWSEGNPAATIWKVDVLPSQVIVADHPAVIEYVGNAPTLVQGLVQMNVRLPDSIADFYLSQGATYIQLIYDPNNVGQSANGEIAVR